MDHAVIEVEGLEKTYANNGVAVEALRNINLRIGAGEFLAIAGPSGSGKTTLLNIIGLLDEQTRGRLLLDGHDLAGVSRQERARIRLRRMGFIFQAYNLIPVLTALENIEFVMMLQGVGEKERRARALAVMEELGIGDLAEARPARMSGGQQQRVAVARAIVHQPPIVLADEPTANLDSKTAHVLIDIMNRLCEERNITFVFSSHDQNVLDHSRRLVLLHDGEIVSDERK
ncbi:MAG: ABC transporter ATP-binding protein [Ignavibacteriae bacterium]|nr:ABC transporter ATP-binding protein [Ignavibacteriota bacterium]